MGAGSTFTIELCRNWVKVEAEAFVLKRFRTILTQEAGNTKNRRLTAGGIRRPYHF